MFIRDDHLSLPVPPFDTRIAVDPCHDVASALRALCCILVILFLATSAYGQTNDHFTIIALPDTQNEADRYPNILDSEIKWIVDNRSNLNIGVVLGLGDIVNDGADGAQQQNANVAIEQLDSAGIPYLLAIGNHDYDKANAGAAVRNATGFNQYWGPARYAGKSYIKGRYVSNSNENFYGVLNLLGRNYLFLMLEYIPRNDVLVWAAGIIAGNADKDVIVVTHSFMYSDGTRVDRCDTQDLNRDNDGEETWNKFLSRYPNIHLVLNGHITNYPGASRRKDLGINGNLVNQIFSNYQDWPNGGDGWLRIMTYYPSQNLMKVSTFSPWRQAHGLTANMSDPKNEFQIPFRAPGVTAGTLGSVAGRVRGDRNSASLYSCRNVANANVSFSSGTSAITGSTGYYHFDAITPSTYTLTARAPGWSSVGQITKVNAGYANDLNFYMAPIVGSVTGRVVNASGAGISGAHVHFVGGTISTNKTYTTGSTGYFNASSISIGSYQVTASATNHTSQTKTSNVSNGVPSTLNFTLQ